MPADGGYTLTGQFPFASNCKHADWFMALGVVMEGNEPKTVNGVPVVKIHAFPMKEAQLIENYGHGLCESDFRRALPDRHAPYA